MSPPESPVPSGLAAEAYPLRLIAARGGLGVELYRPLPVGPLRVTELQWSLPGVRFPVDLSGGVRSFSNRRGELVRMSLGTDVESLSRWLAPRLRHLLGGTHERPTVWRVQGGVGVGLWCKKGALAFDLLWAPEGAEARVVLDNPRGVGFPGPAVSQALAAMDAAFKSFGMRRGRLFNLGRIADAIVRAELPELGVRAPSTGDVLLGELQTSGDELAIEADLKSPPELLPVVGRALGLAELLENADDALLAADPDEARRAYLTALEAAPRHPEICRLIAALDSAHAERTEAALGLLVESLPVTSFGLLGSELLLKTGDRGGAEMAVEKAVVGEPYAPVAALCWTRLAELSDELERRLEYLDRALGLSPRCTEARWARLMARLLTSDVNGALSDAEHLEAAARGAEDRHHILVRAGQLLQERGFVAPAGKLFERALRYVPKACEAALGLAESLIATGQAARALPLLERASQAEDEITRSRACLVWAKLLASAYRDLPQAIARASRVSRARANDAIEARGLEAHWRRQLGDSAGAALAYSRLHDAVQTSLDFDVSRATEFLLEGAQFAVEHGDDVHAAHRYVGLALKNKPHDPRVQAFYKDVARLVTERPVRALGLPHDEQED